MENIVLVKIQTIINQRIHNNFCQKFLTQLKIETFDHQN